jgi:NAD(P) transhydrogenase subunit alpha
MKIAVVTETFEAERRVAISADAVKKYVALGASVSIEKGAGEASSIADTKFKEAGAEITENAEAALKDADIILTVNGLDAALLAHAKQGAHLLGMLAPHSEKDRMKAYADKNIHTYALELLPRISRAQAMDVLSSQSNLSGYRAVIEAAHCTSKLLPMMMTAAGTIPPAKVLVLGAGVAGLQAIATAKRLGAVVSAFDVRAAVKEQVQSLGGKFVEVAPSEHESDGADSGDAGTGYAKEMDDDYKKRQEEAIHNSIITQDIVISTALIPGKPAPELITAKMLSAMKKGAVIVDLAAAAGGNCKASKAGKITHKNGITLIGYTDLPSRAAADATPLYARNLYQFVSALMIDAESKNLAVQFEDELVKGTLLTKDGSIVHADFQ